MSGQTDNINLETALVLLSALIVGAVTGILSYFSSHDWAAAILAGGVAFAGGTYFFDKLIKKNEGGIGPRMGFILIGGFVAGIFIGVLAYFAWDKWAAAVLVGIIGLVITMIGLNSCVQKE